MMENVPRGVYLINLSSIKNRKYDLHYVMSGRMNESGKSFVLHSYV